MATFIDLSGDRGKENLGKRVVYGLVSELGQHEDSDAYRELVCRNEAEITRVIEGYVRQVGDRVAQVMVSVNDYRESLGVGLVSVNVEAQDEGRCTILLSGDVKSPTLGLVGPSNIAGGLGKFTRVGFKVSPGQAERISAVSETLRFGDAATPNGVVLSERINRGDTPLTVLDSEYVTAELPIVDVKKFYFNDLPNVELGSPAIEPPPAGDQVYFCRYLTAKAAIGCCDR